MYIHFLYEFIFSILFSLLVNLDMAKKNYMYTVVKPQLSLCFIAFARVISSIPFSVLCVYQLVYVASNYSYGNTKITKTSMNTVVNPVKLSCVTCVLYNLHVCYQESTTSILSLVMQKNSAMLVLIHYLLLLKYMFLLYTKTLDV